MDHVLVAAMVAISIVIGLLLGVSLAEESSIEDWVYRYQTLISGLIALAAAAWGVTAIYRQIRQADLIEKQRLEKRKQATRAVLPLTLSGFSTYALEVSRVLSDIFVRIEQRNARGEVQPDLVGPAVPNRAVDGLKEFVELSEDGEARYISLLLSDIQVLAANIDATFSDLSGRRGIRSVVAPNLAEYAIRAAKIYARAGTLFEYARGETNHVPTQLTWRDVDSSLFIIHTHGNLLHRSREIVASRQDNNRPVD